MAERNKKLVESLLKNFADHVYIVVAGLRRLGESERKRATRLASTSAYASLYG